MAVASTITISGLDGAQNADAAGFPVTGTDAAELWDRTTDETGTWEKDTSSFVVTLKDGTVIADTITFSFTLQNSATAQASPGISVQVSIAGDGPNEAPIVAIAMSKATGDLLGITGGNVPLYVVVPTFATSAVGHSSPLANVENTLAITLQADCDLAAGTTITISGLTSQTSAAATGFALGGTDANTVWDGTTREKGSWDQGAGMVVLTHPRRRDARPLLFRGGGSH